MRAACLLAAALLGACSTSTSHIKSDWEVRNEGRLVREDAETLTAAELPRYPKRENLIEFKVSAAAGFRFFIDRDSLSVRGGVVRYTLVARSASGVDTVNYEAIRCASKEHRIYAFGRLDGSWAVSAARWREITADTAQRWQTTLQHDFFCVEGLPLRSAEEGVLALEQGVHPFVRSREGVNAIE